MMEIAKITYGLDEAYVWRRDRKPTVTVQADPAGGLQPTTVFQRLRPQVVDPHAGIGVDAALLDQPAAPQHPQVTADRWSGDRELRRQLTGAPGTLAEQFDDAPAGRVGEGRQRGVDIGNHEQHY